MSCYFDTGHIWGSVTFTYYIYKKDLAIEWLTPVLMTGLLRSESIHFPHEINKLKECVTSHDGNKRVIDKMALGWSYGSAL